MMKVVVLTVLLVGCFTGIQSANYSRQCPKGVPLVNCFVDPCMFQTCPKQGAVCVANYCGGCNFNWFLNGQKINCEGMQSASSPLPCPNGVPLVNCVVDPCMFQSCSIQGAVCVANYCGGCNFNWFLNGKQINCGGSSYQKKMKRGVYGNAPDRHYLWR